MVQTRIVSTIKQTHYTPHQRGIHTAADNAEKKKFGVMRFKELNKVINTKVPAHEMAGSNVGGVIRISKKIPKKYRKEIKFHEMYELKRK